MRDCAAVVVVLSPRSVASENVLDEVGFAIDHHKDVIPVLFEPCDVPIRINRLQRIDFDGDYAAALKHCTSILGGEAGRTQAVRAFDPETMRRAEEALTAYVGPIAGTLTAAAVARTHNAGDLYRALSAHIPDVADRAAFLRRAPAHSGLMPAFVFSRAVLEAVIAELAKFLGPIARRVVEQVAREATDLESLYEGVARRLSDAGERAALLERLRALD